MLPLALMSPVGSSRSRTSPCGWPASGRVSQCSARGEATHIAPCQSSRTMLPREGITDLRRDVADVGLDCET